MKWYAIAVLALAPNPALQLLRVQRATQAAQDNASAQIGQLIRQTEKNQNASDPQHQALIKELKNAQQAAKTAPDPQSAVAALSQAQADWRPESARPGG